MTVGAMVGAREHERPQLSGWQSVGRLALVAAVFGVLVVVNWSLAVFVVLLLISITLHEFGHYLGAKRGGMKPTEFFIGFGPRIFSFRRGETEFGLKPILLGAYVKVPGMHNLEEVDPADEPRTYRAQSYGRRFRMVFAGPGMNLLIALVGFCVFFSCFTQYQTKDTGTPTVAIDAGAAAGPASAAGVRDGDMLLTIDGHSFAGIRQARDFIRSLPGQTVDLVVERDGQQLTIPVTLGTNNPASGEHVGFLGVAFQGIEVPVDRSIPAGVAEGFREFGREVGGTVVAIGKIFSPSGLSKIFSMVTGQQRDNPTERPTSIVGIGKVGSRVVEQGVGETVLLLAALNLALGMFNLLPLLPFDGGHLLIATYERVRTRRGRPPYRVDFAKVMPVFGPLLVVVLFVVASAVYLDIK